MEVLVIIIVFVIITVAIIYALSNKAQAAGTYEPVDTFTTLMPVEAVSEIRSGRLPRLVTDKVVLASGEYCHFIDKAYLLHDRVLKRYHTQSKSVSYPSLMSVLFNMGQFGVKYRRGESRTQVEEIPVTERFKGLLFITNRRIIFVGKQSPFDKPFKFLTAKITYSDGIELQFGGKYMSLLVPDGATAGAVVDLVLSRRNI
jgi:hypothetical protein